MAMRGRSNPNRPPRLKVGRVYEQFKPMSEWRQEDDYDTLLVYLPGFQKENIKVTTEDLNIVRVRGERLVTENKWSRFQEDFRVPENCEMRGIRARFYVWFSYIEIEVITGQKTRSRKLWHKIRLSINCSRLPPFLLTGRNACCKACRNACCCCRFSAATFDKPQEWLHTQHYGGILTITMPRKIINVPPPTTTTTQVAPKTEEQPFKRTKQEEATQKPKEEIKEKKPEKPKSSATLDENPLPPQPMPTGSSYTPSTKQEPLKNEPEANESSEEFRFGSLPTSVPKKADKHDVLEKPNIAEKTDLNAGGKEIQTLLGDRTKNIEGEMGKLNDSRSVQAGGKMEENKVVGRRGLGVLNEDRKVLVNVGVGVLVIVALGVHISHTIGLIGSEGK